MYLVMALDETPTDQELWLRIGAGDRSAFETVYLRHRDAIYRHCYYRSNDRDSAFDLSADTFCVLWDKRHTIRVGPEGVRPIVFGIATNLTRNHRRRGGNYLRLLGRLDREPQPVEPDISVRAVARDEVDRAKTLLDNLPSSQQDVLQLIAWAGLSYEETALALNIPVGTVRSRLARARAHLRNSLIDPNEVTSA